MEDAKGDLAGSYGARPSSAPRRVTPRTWANWGCSWPICAAAVEQVREYERRLVHVVRVLALTPGRGSLVQLLRLLDERRPSTAGSGLLPRFVASLLAEHQQVTDLAAAVFDGREWERLDELRACLFQELVLRDVDIDTFPALRSWPLVRHGRHPLAWLPVYHRDFEANADFPNRSIRGSASGVPSRLPEEGRISYYGAGSELSRQSWVARPAHGWAGISPCPAGA